MGRPIDFNTPHRLIVVDDEEVIRSTVSDFLIMKGYDVQTASDGRKALELFRESGADLVISDVRMPGMSGVELLGHLHTISPETGVIMMTAYSDTDSAVICMKEGAFDYVTKPFNYEEFLITVERALEKTRLVQLNRLYHNTLEQKVMEQAARIQEVFTESISSLTMAIEAKDEYTKGHSLRVTEYCQSMTDRMDIGFEERKIIITAAQLHDIGKLGISDSVLNKPAKLSDEEFVLVKRHPVTSGKILKPLLDSKTLSYVEHHHERWDGRGYPDGLSGSDIPFGARVIALADTFDAMTSKRAYRDAQATSRAIDEIKRCSGSQFDPDLVPVFLGVMAETA